VWKKIKSGTAVIAASGPHNHTSVTTVKKIATGLITMRRDSSHG